MNSKKNKGKSSRKPPTQTTEDENKNYIDVIKSENLNLDKTRVPEVVTESINIAEYDQSTNNTPKKPKRSKGTKKIEPSLENIKTEEESNDPVENIEHIKEIIRHAPCVRKKKKKEKNENENLKENLVDKGQVVLKCSDADCDKETSVKSETFESDPVNIEVLPENIYDTPKDDVTCKKKKRKKKLHDSEKTDLHNPCTLAFQKLIEPICMHENFSKTNTPEIQEIKTETKDCIESIINPDEKTEEFKLAEHTNKKKNKKGKKNPPEKRIDVAKFDEAIEQNKISLSTENMTLLENSENMTVTKEVNEKTKAKIIKPVQKKRQNKSENDLLKTPTDDNLEIDTCENKNKETFEVNLITKTNENESYPDKIVLKEAISKSNSEIIKHDTTNIQVTEMSKCQSMEQTIHKDYEKPSNSITTPENNQEIPKNIDNLGFVEVKAGKCKKKRNKAISTLNACNTTESHNILKDEDVQNLDIKSTVNSTGITSEKQETQNVIIPDLIEYPRSTSQQFIDGNNNNIYIEDITTTEEVKLDNVVPTASPIIQGSGESPEVKIKEHPTVINATEINTTPSSSKDSIILQSAKDQTSGKIDIKSKMVEVNRDMEGLKRSIERSLAELTAIGKSDAEVDKEFEELFQSQTEEQLPTDKTAEKLSIHKTGDDKKDCENSFTVSDNKYDTRPIETNEKTEEMDIKENVKTESKEFPNVLLASDNSEIKVAPICPARSEKSKNKSKKKGKKEVVSSNSNTNTPVIAESNTESADKNSKKNTESADKDSQKNTESAVKDSKKNTEKSEPKSESTKEKGKQQTLDGEKDTNKTQNATLFEPIENFEDALTSSVDDINQTFEIIAKNATNSLNLLQYQNNPQINIISPVEDSEEEYKQDTKEIKKKQSPISRPKNLLGHPNIPASSNKTDFKKEKSKPPNAIRAKVKIKDSVEIENDEEKKPQREKNVITKSNSDDSSYLLKTNEDLVYKYSFRKVFLQNICHVCKNDLVHRVPCKFCSLVFYCSQKHKDEDWSQHQSLCFAVCTIAHLREQKHIYADAQNIWGHNYRVLRMQTILSCERILNRKLVPWEQEALLYPRICSDVKCRQWKQGALKDCAGCGQLSYCIDHPEHLPPSHQRWCKSYALYQRLVNYQLTKGRLEPPLPTKVMIYYQMPGKINDVLGSIFEEKIDMDEIQYASLTQIATAPLTAAYSYQVYSSKKNSTCANGIRKNLTFTIHMVGTELPFEADSLNKWETFFLHLRPDVQDLRVVMVGPDINSSKLPLDLLAKIKLCEDCQSKKRRVLFEFHDKESYHDYVSSDGFVAPDIVCAFNANIHRSFAFNTETWPSTMNSILRQRVPFVLTSYSIEELRRDVGIVRECTSIDFNVVSEIKHNPFGSVRPDRNFITDHEIPLLFKNYCFCILCGTL